LTFRRDGVFFLEFDNHVSPPKFEGALD
jgi:hypothetical protein